MFNLIMALRKIALVSNRLNCRNKINYLQLTDAVGNIRSFETSARFKGTFLERWGKYWKNLYIDYRDVAVDVVKDFKARPVRSSVYIALLGSSYYLSQHNPDTSSYRDQLIQNEAKLMQVGRFIRNPVSENYVTWVEQCFNEGIVRRLNLGIISFMWLDNFDRATAVYKATCPYLKPRYLTFYQRIIDIGFMDRWWLLEEKMHDYDVNQAEFLQSSPNKESA
ncbi:mitochondrial import inner membrane translocase subunit Tim29 [Belonocnema kinseyi]|uniref:mitochondrial import inner membrane translocase subunit Tim29 n=1 Tax=Belonocnema kinseyi TaxID=2817044 RepID=UPI00143D6639|nr:mitochondrial import inner membrane translocase subunit Tim29 [Belonocnema kinseyi]